MTFVSKKNIDQNQAEHDISSKEDISVRDIQTAPKPETTINSTKHTILIVDDEKSILKTLRRSLVDENYRILTAENSKEAIELISANNITIVISDYSMPGGSGADFLGTVKREWPQCIRIMLSGAAETDKVPDAIAQDVLNCQRFIFKPWDDEQLRKIIRECMAQYEASL